MNRKFRVLFASPDPTRKGLEEAEQEQISR